jgi:hypothetical protein
LDVVGCYQPFVTEAASYVWKLLDHWLSYKTMTMLCVLVIFLVDLNLLIFLGCLLFFKAGLVQGRTSEASARQDFRTGLDAYACLTSDFRVMSGLTCSGS